MPQHNNQHRLAAAETKRLLRERTGRSYVVLAARAATLIWAALRGLDLNNRNVLLPANACYIVLWTVIDSGNVPVLVDVDKRTSNLSVDMLNRPDVPRADVVIPAHIYGIPAPMAELCAWAREHSTFVIEDAALAPANRADGKPAGAWGDVSVFSFGDGKTIDAGIGGALLTDDAALAREIERLVEETPLWDQRLSSLNRQWLEIYWAMHQFEAENSRLLQLYPTLFDIYRPILRARLPQRAVPGLLTSLKQLDAHLAHRLELARFYDDALAGSAARTLDRPPDAVLWRYPLLVPERHRNALLADLWAAGLHDVTRWYPTLQPMRAALAPQAPSTLTPAADLLSCQIINLPLSPQTDQGSAARAVYIIQKLGHSI